MLTDINPKLPMRDKAITMDFYINKLGFQLYGSPDFPGYLMLQKDAIQIHFFEYKELNPLENYGQVYIRTDAIDAWYDSLKQRDIQMPALGKFEMKPWGQKEFSIIDPDHNLLTFGESI